MSITIFWFRRDLRLNDNKAFFRALKNSGKVLPLFIFDEDILDPLPQNDHRVEFIHNTLSVMDQALRKQGSGILVIKGKPFDVFSRLLDEFDIEAVYSNVDHEPYGLQRDKKVMALLAANGIGFFQELDHLVLGAHEALKPDGTPYSVFTPFSRRWKETLESKHLDDYPSENLLKYCAKVDIPPIPSLKELGFEPSGMEMPVVVINEGLIRHYHENRNFPSKNGVSRLSPHLRFGTLSIRQLTKLAQSLNEAFLNELIWREFYAMILFHFPRVVNESFRPEYDRIAWLNNEAEFEQWKQGRTGFPLIDAGMRQLSATGYMHNRLRMVAASFLTKHLLIDWRWGQAWFAEKLFDFELSSNNGGWQWSAGAGTDAAPYFRIFNPVEQQKKFDPDKVFISKWVTEYGYSNYPKPMIDLKMARDRCLAAYKKALQA